MVDWFLPRDAAGVALARTHLRGLGQAVPGESLDDAVLLVSELVTNAVRHGGGDDVRVTAALCPGGLRVGVGDDGPGFPVRREADEDDTNGRGVAIVAALADQWGVDVHPDDGKTVWFTLRW